MRLCDFVIKLLTSDSSGVCPSIEYAATQDFYSEFEDLRVSIKLFLLERLIKEH